VVPTGQILGDVSARRAASYKYAHRDPYPWWDRRNVTFPNFPRWEAYGKNVTHAAGRSVTVWQIPECNQYFGTENNTNGHYQDNRAEYFFGHMDELAQAGVIGLLFGAGNGGSTVNAHRGSGLSGIFKKTLPLHDPQVTTIRGSSIDQLSFGQILAHAQGTPGRISQGSGLTINGVATDAVTLILTKASAGYTREVIEISRSTHFPLRVLGYDGPTLVRKIDYVGANVTR